MVFPPMSLLTSSPVRTEPTILFSPGVPHALISVASEIISTNLVKFIDIDM